MFIMGYVYIFYKLCIYVSEQRKRQKCTTRAVCGVITYQGHSLFLFNYVFLCTFLYSKCICQIRMCTTMHLVILRKVVNRDFSTESRYIFLNKHLIFINGILIPPYSIKSKSMYFLNYK